MRESPVQMVQPGDFEHELHRHFAVEEDPGGSFDVMTDEPA